MATVVDYAGGVPSAASIKAAGHVGAVRYISPARPGAAWMKGKPMLRGEVEDFRAHGLDIACIWQFGKDRDSSDVMRGAVGGELDALSADQHLKSIGLDGWPVYFAVDFPIGLTDWNDTAVHYFRAAAKVLGKGRVGIYGHSRVCHWAGPEDGVIAEVSPGRYLAMVTRGWSTPGETGAGYATLYQGIVDTESTPGPVVGGVVVDVSDVLHDYWGQRPPNESPKEVVPVSAPIKPHHGRRGDPVWLPEVLRAFGVEVKEMDGWKDWGTGDFDNIDGIVAHHTAGSATSAEFIAFNTNLGSQLSSQIHLARDGVATMCGAGIAYHAGEAVAPPEWTGYVTRNAAGNPSKSFTKANAVTIGIEAVNRGNGTQVWPEVQMDSYARICAAILWYLGLPISKLKAHKEIAPRRKVDPNFNMASFRGRVKSYLDNPPFDAAETTTDLGGLFMSLPKERQEDLARKIDRIHHELTNRFDSRYDLERLRQGEITPDEVYSETMIGHILDDNRKIEDMHAHMLPGLIEVTEWVKDAVGKVATSLSLRKEK